MVYIGYGDVMKLNHILLFNPLDQQWKCFHRIKDVPLKAEVYGTPISSGYTVDECITGAVNMGVPRWDIQVIE